MGLGQKLLGDPHGYADDASGGLIRRARLYEFSAAIAFAGFRGRVYDLLVAESGAAAGNPVLDIGCGTGYFARRIAAAVEPGGTVIGIDPSPPVIAYATRVAPPNCTFHVAAAQQLPLPDASFDLVVSSLAVHHIPPDLRPDALREMLRVLHPGGRLFIADFRPPRNRIANHLIGALSGHAMQHNPIHELPDLVAAAGFRVTGTGDCRPMLSYITAVRP
jgi:ubiquinone/menaquinone biosynthesis C-methylase UbiE